MHNRPGASVVRWGPVTLAVVMTGVMLGGVNSLSNVFGSPYSAYALRPNDGIPSLQVLAAVIGTAWAWALVAFALGWWSRTLWLAPLTGALALTLASVVYYLSDYAFGLNEKLETGEMTYWVLVSVGAGPVFGVLGHLASDSRWWSLLPGMTVPALIAIFTFSYPAGSDDIQPWPELLAWLIAATLTVALSSRWLLRQRHPRIPAR